jgi:hypothetical protein
MVRSTLTILAAVLLSSCDGGKPETALLPGSSSPPDLAGLQRLADAACRCVRASPDDRSCGEELAAATAPYGPAESMASACVPVSTVLECFNQKDPSGGFCVTTGYVSIGGKVLCSAEEAKAVESVFAEKLTQTGGNHAAATSAATQAADALIRGKTVAVPDVAGGCTG